MVCENVQDGVTEPQPIVVKKEFMPCLSPFQVMILAKLANSTVKVYAACGSTPADRQRDRIDDDYNEALELIRWGLCTEISNDPKISRFVAKIVADYQVTGRRVSVLKLTTAGQLLFERNPWETSIN